LDWPIQLAFLIGHTIDQRWTHRHNKLADASIRNRFFAERKQMTGKLTFTLLCGSLLLLLMAECQAWQLADKATPEPEEPIVAEASDEGQRAMKGFKYPSDWQINLFAAEPDVANPVAFYLDYQGRVFVCESFRQGKGIEDNRKHGEWLDEDLAAQTVEDRLAYIQRHLQEKAVEYTRYDDRIRLLRDENHDGVADKATVFAKHFNTILSGTGAGVLSYRDKVYYTCIPDLWLLQDKDGDDVAEIRESLHYGYGIRFAFRGHDMHGLIIGPEGRLYFSIGDRGANLKTASGTLANIESGSVFRCELDGSNLEIFATGLRNPQELAFDDYGNLFTGDNNSDSGDKARWVYVVEDGDSGWRMAYQYLDDRGPFNREKIWHPFDQEQPAYIVPPIDNLSDGPSGLAFYPGTGLSEEFKDRFFLCDFRGQASNSGVRTFRLKPKGAFFEIADSEQTLWNILVTDVDFGPDGALYVSDWVNGWEGLNKGRLYRFISKSRDEALVKQVAKILREGLSTASYDELTKLISHPDRRVRQEAQFERVHRGEIEALVNIAISDAPQLGRIHAIWGLGQLARSGKLAELPKQLVELFASEDAEVRAQLVKLVGEAGFDAQSDNVLELITDQNPRVQYFAMRAAGKLGLADAIPSIVDVLVQNDNQDPILRHGAHRALAEIGNAAELAKLLQHESAAVRLATVVALRNLGDEQIALALQDRDEAVVVEAARAIHDLPIEKCMPALAAMIETPFKSDALLRRVLSANFRLGTADHLQAVLQFAAQEHRPMETRKQAVDMINQWAVPGGRDLVLGIWRKLESRDKAMVVKIVKQNLSTLGSADPQISRAFVKAAAALGIKDVAGLLASIVADTKLSGEDRADALRSLETLEYEPLANQIKKLVTDSEVPVRIAARDIMSRLDPDSATQSLSAALQAENVDEQQAAYATLGSLQTEKATALLTSAIQRLQAGKVDPAVQLDVLLAAEKSEDQQLQKLVAAYRESKPTDDPLAAFTETLMGGHAGLGAEIFYHRAEVSCLRCHKVDGQGGEVGPDLSKIGLDKDRRYLLESIVAPNQQIAKGFETVIVDTIDGLTFTGIIKEETDEFLTLIDAQANIKRIPMDDIDARSKGDSGMPADIVKQLSPSDLRNLIEFLATRKSDGSAENLK
jgi:quinoprotein glucose dehydrogenase